MTTDRPIVHRFSSGADLAKQAAADIAELLERLMNDTAEQVHICLTGGTIGIATLAELSSKIATKGIAFDRLHIWWGDERFLPVTHADRNAVQAKKALLDHIQIPAANIHVFPSPDSGLSLDQATENFAKHFSEVAPKFDLVLLGMGSDGHVNSLFPGKTAPKPGQKIVAEHHSPKPPPERISMTYEVVNSARRVWILVAGADKADAVTVAFGDSPMTLPIGRVRGEDETRWYLDSSAAAQVFGC